MPHQSFTPRNYAINQDVAQNSTTVTNLQNLRSTRLGLVLMIITLCSGCADMAHSLRPSQLWKLNRGPELGRDSYNFSIPSKPLDPEAEKLMSESAEYIEANSATK